MRASNIIIGVGFGVFLLATCTSANGSFPQQQLVSTPHARVTSILRAHRQLDGDQPGGDKACVDDPKGLAKSVGMDCECVAWYGSNSWWNCGTYDDDFEGHATYIWEICPKSCGKCGDKKPFFPGKNFTKGGGHPFRPGAGPGPGSLLRHDHDDDDDDDDDHHHGKGGDYWKKGGKGGGDGKKGGFSGAGNYDGDGYCDDDRYVHYNGYNRGWKVFIFVFWTMVIGTLVRIVTETSIYFCLRKIDPEKTEYPPCWSLFFGPVATVCHYDPNNCCAIAMALFFGWCYTMCCWPYEVPSSSSPDAVYYLDPATGRRVRLGGGGNQRIVVLQMPPGGFPGGLLPVQQQQQQQQGVQMVPMAGGIVRGIPLARLAEAAAATSTPGSRVQERQQSAGDTATQVQQVKLEFGEGVENNPVSMCLGSMTLGSMPLGESASASTLAAHRFAGNVVSPQEDEEEDYKSEDEGRGQLALL